MGLQIFAPEELLFLEAIFIIGLILFMIINKNFTYVIYIWLLSVMFLTDYRMEIPILPDLSVDRILFTFIVFMFFIQSFAKKQKIFSLTGVEYVMFLFCIYALISMIWTGYITKETGGIKIAELLTGYIYPFMMFFISRSVFDNFKKRENFFRFIILIGLYLSLIAIFEHFNIRSLIWPKYPHYDIYLGRSMGPFGQAAVNGTVLGFAMTVSYYFLFSSNIETLWRILSMFVLVSSSSAIFFTYTRAAWLATFLGAVVFMVLAVRQKMRAAILILIWLCIISLAAVSFLLNSNTAAFAIERIRDANPIFDRLNLYVAYMNIFLQHPWFGIGFGKFPDVASRYFIKVHNIPLGWTGLGRHDTFAGVLAEMGLVGMALLSSIYFFILLKSIRIYRRSRYNIFHIRFVIIFWSFMVVYIVNSIFIEMRYFEFVNSLFFILAGIIFGLERDFDEKIVW